MENYIENGIIIDGTVHELKDAGEAGNGHKCLECSLYSLCMWYFDKAALCNINGKNGKDNESVFFKAGKSNIGGEEETERKKSKFSGVVKPITNKELLQTMEYIEDKKELRVKAPDGYEIDKKNSTFDCIKFKKKGMKYNDVANEMFFGKEFYCMCPNGKIQRAEGVSCVSETVIAKTRTQLEKLFAFNKLMTVATYLNDGWEPDFYDKSEKKFYLFMLNGVDTIRIGEDSGICNVSGQVYFKSNETAQQAIDILGEHTVRLALMPYFLD